MLAALATLFGVAETGCDQPTSIYHGGKYVLGFGNVSFAVDPAGARVTDVHLVDGNTSNLLTGPSVNATNYGSTFWTSPQSSWGWPPPPEIDTAVYAASATNTSVSFVGPTNAVLGASVSKRFTADPVNSRIVAEYSISTQDAGKMFAPWEITRVFPGGLTFFPTGVGGATAGRGFALPPTQDQAGCTWYQHPGVAPGADQKLLADGSGGWLAHVAGDTVIVKKFADVPADMAAPGEAEIEIFVQGQGAYVEIEQQGAYQAVAPQQPLQWSVTWIVSRLPAAVKPTAGNLELVQFVQGLVR